MLRRYGTSSDSDKILVGQSPCLSTCIVRYWTYSDEILVGQSPTKSQAQRLGFWRSINLFLPSILVASFLPFEYEQLQADVTYQSNTESVAGGRRALELAIYCRLSPGARRARSEKRRALGEGGNWLKKLCYHARA